MTTKEILIAARALVAKGWTQGKYARRDNGAPTPPGADDAVCWCPIGALMAVIKTPLNPLDPTNTLGLRALQRAIGLADLPRWNDDPARTQADILAAFDKAIASEP